MTALLDKPRRVVGDVGRAAARLRAAHVAGSIPPPAPVSLISIYRCRNASTTRRLVDVAQACGWTTALWGLDGRAKSLADWTVGTGRGEKFPLLNEIVRRSGVDSGWTVVADDDVVFVGGSVDRLVAIAGAAHLSLSQPAHARSSTVSHEITIARTMSVVRRTTFVEIGPVFVVSPEARDRIIPFPASHGMGWGLELEWMELVDLGFHLGIVDAISIVHLGAVGVDYPTDREKVRMMRELQRRGIARWRDVQKETGVWRPWQRRPPWVHAAAVSARTLGAGGTP